MPPFSNFTVKAQEAVRRAHEIAIEKGQNQLEPIHLLAALVVQEESLVTPLLERMGLDIVFVTDSINDNMADLGLLQPFKYILPLSWVRFLRWHTA